MRLRALMFKEFTQIFRDRIMLFLILWLYTVEILICAHALALDMRRIPLAIADLDISAESRALVDSLTAPGTFRAERVSANTTDIESMLQSGTTHAVLVVPNGFGADLVQDRTTEIQLLLDGSNTHTAAIARGYVLRTVGAFERRASGDTMMRVGRVEPRVRVWYNPNQTNVSFIVLSMIALAALMVGVIHPAASIVREKEMGNIEQLRVTPVAVWELFVAKTAPTLLIALWALFPALAIAGWFGIPLLGSLPLFIALTALFLVSAIGIGVLIATVSATLQQALLLSFFGLFPVMFLSGTLVPVESMPVGLQWAAQASPLLHYLEITLGIFLKGVGWSALQGHALALAGIGGVLFATAAALFRSRVS